MGRYELNKLTSLPMCGFIAQLVEHRTGIAEVTGSNPVEALIFFRLLLSNCLNWKIYCDDHISLSSKTAVQIWIISYKLHNIFRVIENQNWQLWKFYAPRLWPSEHHSFTTQLYFFFRRHGNKSCKLIGSLPGQYFTISAHGPQ